MLSIIARIVKAIDIVVYVKETFYTLETSNYHVKCYVVNDSYHQ